MVLSYTSSMKISFADETFQRVISTKPNSWKYEEEMRYVEAFSGLCDQPGPLEELIFGLRCPADRRNHYIELLKEHSETEVKLFEIKKRLGTNTLERVVFDPPSIIPSPSRTKISHRSAKSSEMHEQEFTARMQQLIQQEHYGEVIFQITENLKHSPDAANLHDLKATAHGLAGEHQLALGEYKYLTEKHPDIAGGWYGMACAYVSLKQLNYVVPLLRKAHNLDTNDTSILLNLGIHLITDPKTHKEGLAYLHQAEALGHRRARQIINHIVETEEK
ncbi:MAG: hypothetical protein QM488_16540 [Rhizobiaceae bacterium]